MSAPVFGVADVLALGANWEPQSNSPTSAGTRATATGPTGDLVAETTHNVIESGSAAYKYLDITVAGFAAAFAADSCDVGDLVDTNTLIIVGIDVDYSPCAAGERPLVTFSYRDGPTAAPATPFVFLSALTLPTYTAANVEIPSILGMTLGSAEVTNAKWSLTMQYGADLDKDGEYLSGQGYMGEETITLDFVGTPTSITSTGYQQVSGPGSNTGENRSQVGYGASQYVFTKGITRT